MIEPAWAIERIRQLAETAVSTVVDVAPIMFIIFFFQLVILRQPIYRFKEVLLGVVFVLAGMTLFIQGLELALFPMGRQMAQQLTAVEFLGQASQWHDYIWVFVFAAAIGFATTIAEPSVSAVAQQAEKVSGGAIRANGLRLAVSVGAACGIALGTFRIVTGTPLPLYIIGGYLIVIVQTLRAPKLIVPLAYDSGGVTTSTVTVPLVAALGLGLAEAIPGRDPLIDGFGLIAFACLFPIISVLGYAQLSEWQSQRQQRKSQAVEQEAQK